MAKELIVFMNDLDVALDANYEVPQTAYICRETGEVVCVVDDPKTAESHGFIENEERRAEVAEDPEAWLEVPKFYPDHRPNDWGKEKEQHVIDFLARQGIKASVGW